MSGLRLSARRATAVAAAGALLTAIAFTFDASPLFVLGVALLGLGLLAPAWVWATASGADARRVLGSRRVVEDEPLEASIEVHRGRLGLAGWGRIEVLDPFTGSRLDVSGPLSPIRGGATASVRVVARFPRRGHQLLAPPSLVVSDPLDLAEAHTASSEPAQQLLVLPRAEPVRWLISEGARRLDQPDGDHASEAQAAVDVDGLRPYRVGTPASRIHWPAVARGAGLIERRLLADGDSRPLIVLDGRLPEGERPELLDAAVRATASLVLDLARRGGCGLLLPGDPRPAAIDRDLLAWPAAHARLATVHGGPEVRAPALGQLAGRRGATIYIAAAPSARVTALLTATGAGAVLLVVPRRQLAGGRPAGTRGRVSPALDVAGCRGFRLGVTPERSRAARTVA
jgi:uncharacterized protein (DUF58 family)